MTAERARPRSRIAGVALIAVTIALGLGSRRYGRLLPGFVADYAGDTLWALVAFLGLGLIRPRASSARVALLAFAFSALIEASQLYRAPWIERIRSTTPGGLVLGHGFLWSDLACYAIGVGLGVAVEAIRPAGRPVPGDMPSETSGDDVAMG